MVLSAQERGALEGGVEGGTGTSGATQALRPLHVTRGGASQSKGSKEDVHLGQEGGDGALPPQLHLHIQGEVPGLAH